ncbi:MAG: glycosyltransferase family 4 protein [Gammaproteobacteria bacterium]|nr:glycosyltransferase family 4 protein [Gammaproteobacteria bacterium]
MLIGVFLILLSVLSYISIGIYRSYAIKKNILDLPNQRSSHSIPVPRGGGVVFPILWVGFLLISYFINFIEASYLILFLPPVFLISFVGFFDDKYNIPARFRFLAQLIAAIYVLAVLGGFPKLDLGIITIDWGWFGYVFMVLALLWSTNLYNFMDGIDGIAAIEALFVFGFGGYFIWCAGGIELAIIIWSMMAIILGFLFWNKPPAKIFMGDVGSALLGFLVMLFAIIGERKYNVSVFLWIMLYGVFWFDTTVTLIRRLINGDKWYQAHRLHAYQRLQLQEWSHRKILLWVIAINIILACAAFLSFYFPQHMLLALVGVIIILAACYLMIEKSQPMYLR